MDRRGFTLIELLVTILLLAIISVISFVSINKVVEQSKITDCKTLVKSIEMATKDFVSDHRYDKSFNGTGITAKTLIDNNYLTGPIYDPFNNNQQLNPSNITLTITLNSNKTVKKIVVNGVGCTVS